MITVNLSNVKNKTIPVMWSETDAKNHKFPFADGFPRIFLSLNTLFPDIFILGFLRFSLFSLFVFLHIICFNYNYNAC